MCENHDYNESSESLSMMIIIVHIVYCTPQTQWEMWKTVWHAKITDIALKALIPGPTGANNISVGSAVATTVPLWTSLCQSFVFRLTLPQKEAKPNQHFVFCDFESDTKGHYVTSAQLAHALYQQLPACLHIHRNCHFWIA